MHWSHVGKQALRYEKIFFIMMHTVFSYTKLTCFPSFSSPCPPFPAWTSSPRLGCSGAATLAPASSFRFFFSSARLFLLASASAADRAGARSSRVSSTNDRKPLRLPTCESPAPRYPSSSSVEDSPSPPVGRLRRRGLLFLSSSSSEEEEEEPFFCLFFETSSGNRAASLRAAAAAAAATSNSSSSRGAGEGTRSRSGEGGSCSSCPFSLSCLGGGCFRCCCCCFCGVRGVEAAKLLALFAPAAAAAAAAAPPPPLVPPATFSSSS